MKKAIVKIELEYEFGDNFRDKEIENILEDMELPRFYKEDSWELIKIKENE
tara:strand:- start:707 stop:859 length:153 start_codon:yes stop_codon:yes gene_type:complete